MDYFAAFPKRRFLRYDSRLKERLAVKVVPMVTLYRECLQTLALGSLDLGDYLDVGPPI
jgi:hypothetical protein